MRILAVQVYEDDNPRVMCLSPMLAGSERLIDVCRSERNKSVRDRSFGVVGLNPRVMCLSPMLAGSERLVDACP